jgi:hypothetical protein
VRFKRRSLLELWKSPYGSTNPEQVSSSISYAISPIHAAAKWIKNNVDDYLQAESACSEYHYRVRQPDGHCVSTEAVARLSKNPRFLASLWRLWPAADKAVPRCFQGRQP